MAWRWRTGEWTWLLAVGAAGCGPIVGSDDAGSTGAATESIPGTATTLDPPTPTTDPTTDPGTASAATTIDPDPSNTGIDSSGDGTDDGPIFPSPDGGSLIRDCDIWAQDCPEGDRCVPWANDGGDRWNATRCAPLAAVTRELGESCVVEGSPVSGIDDCGFGLMCMFVDPETLVGTCVAHCGGSEGSPLCPDPSTSCVIEFEGVLHECLPTCTPLLVVDCEVGECYASGGPDEVWFSCVIPPSVPSVADFEPCAHDWECTPGSMCSRPDRPAACEFGDCCTPICDLSDPDAEACGPDRSCTSVLPEGQSPGIDNTGYCALP